MFLKLLSVLDKAMLKSGITKAERQTRIRVFVSQPISVSDIPTNLLFNNGEYVSFINSGVSSQKTISNKTLVTIEGRMIFFIQ